MPDIASIGSGSVGPIDRLVSSSAQEQNSQANRAAAFSSLPRDADRVELSDHARFLNRLKELPDGRADVIHRVRSEIAEGVFDTPERLDTAIEKLTHDLGASD